MKKHPILFSGEMVRAILGGRKTQTRRVIKSNSGPPPELVHRLRVNDQHWCEPGGWVRCPYGVPGDRLWVRETWGYRGSCWRADKPDVQELFIHYKADGERRSFPEMPQSEWDRLSTQRPCRPDESSDERHEYLERYWAKWRPSIHMPRWASRITLDVTSVRVERLQDISEADAKAEGMDPWVNPEQTTACDSRPGPHRVSFGILWDTINAKRAPWESNPWVWVVVFEVSNR